MRELQKQPWWRDAPAESSAARRKGDNPALALPASIRWNRRPNLALPAELLRNALSRSALAEAHSWVRRPEPPKWR